jgi:hypothetical protein
MLRILSEFLYHFNEYSIRIKSLLSDLHMYWIRGGTLNFNYFFFKV